MGLGKVWGGHGGGLSVGLEETIQHLRQGKQSSTNTVYSGGGELLTSTGDIVGRWKEYFEDLLNPTDTPSIEEAEAGDSEFDSFINHAEVPEVVQRLFTLFQEVGGRSYAISDATHLSRLGSGGYKLDLQDPLTLSCPD